MPHSMSNQEIQSDLSTPDVCSNDDAVRILQQRLQSVHDYLVMAATRYKESTEYVHQLRISTRRAIAAIELFQDALTRRELKWWKRNLRRIRRAAGNARDLDVFAIRYAKKRIMNKDSSIARRVEKRRRQATIPIRELQNKLCESGKFSMQQTKLLATLKRKSTEAILRHALPARLEKVYQRFLGSLQKINFSKSRFSASKVHRLRIQAKKLRYAIDISADILPHTKDKPLYSTVRNLQSTLGDLNDHASAAERFDKWMAQADTRKQYRRLKKQRKFERQELDRIRRDLSKIRRDDFPDRWFD